MIRLENVRFAYGRQPFIENLGCELPDGRITAILGPNGSGKSTMLRLCAGQIRPQAGEISVNGRGLREYSQKELARELAYLPQMRPAPMLTVRSLAENGRYPYLGLTRRLGPGDIAAVEAALSQVGLSGMAERELRTLSGGEQQKAYVAMLLAQGAQTLLLDEPTTYLDIGHQLELMELMVGLKKQGRCVAMVLHDIDLAMQYCEDAVVMCGGRIIHTGPANELADSGAIEAAYGVRPVPGAGVRFGRIER